MGTMLHGKTGLVLGVANHRSIAWAIAKAAAREGADLVVTAQNERFLKSLTELAAELDRPALITTCDVSEPQQVEQLMSFVREQRGGLDFIVHCLAYAPREELDGKFVDTSAAGFATALGVSAYSLTAVTRAALPLMEGRNAAVLTLSYIGAERVIPHYNVMGVAKAALESSVRYLAADLGPLGHRVNAISAGPIRTLAAAGVSGFSGMLDLVAQRSAMKRNVEPAEVGDAAAFMVSPLSRGITGTVLHVDCGYSVMGI
ncbi:MAG: enoyl-ACP reductase [Planctomycetes bacterium]|nr:enoyl-ACP reductase [Planctomycetota bacterium]